ncbi:hypothetical protein TNCV_4296241 [Trichonephila clavipes]|nr:hypothetical protein TNCV_4296241 [Trichonephila clavipes]
MAAISLKGVGNHFLAGVLVNQVTFQALLFKLVDGSKISSKAGKNDVGFRFGAAKIWPGWRPQVALLFDSR